MNCEIAADAARALELLEDAATPACPSNSP